MKFKELYEALCEVSDNDYKQIKRTDRIVMSDTTSITPPNIPSSKQRIDFKPIGMWYGIGTEWVDWVRSEMSHWETDNVFKIDINPSKMLFIKNENDVIKLQEQYGVDKFGMGDYKIDWSLVAKDYSGIEFNPYHYALSRKYMWYYSIDVASGCIWDKGALKRAQAI